MSSIRFQRPSQGRPSFRPSRGGIVSVFPPMKSTSWSAIACDFPPSNSSSSDVGSLTSPRRLTTIVERHGRPPPAASASRSFFRASFVVTVVFPSPSPKTPRGSLTRSLRTEATVLSRTPLVSTTCEK